MPRITFIEPGGERREVEAEIGDTLLVVAHKNGIAIEGACEGCLACSTCHVIVDPDWFERLPPAEDDEEDMLDIAFGLTQTSRLGCQLEASDEMDGLIVSLPAETRNMM